MSGSVHGSVLRRSFESSLNAKSRPQAAFYNQSERWTHRKENSEEQRISIPLSFFIPLPIQVDNTIIIHPITSFGLLYKTAVWLQTAVNIQ